MLLARDTRVPAETWTSCAGKPTICALSNGERCESVDDHNTPRTGPNR